MNQTCWPLTVHEVPYFSLESFRVGITSHVCKSLSRRPSHPKRMVSFFRWYNYSASEFHFQQWQRFHVSPTHWGSSPDSRAWRATTEHVNLAFPRGICSLEGRASSSAQSLGEANMEFKEGKGEAMGDTQVCGVSPCKPWSGATPALSRLHTPGNHFSP